MLKIVDMCYNEAMKVKLITVGKIERKIFERWYCRVYQTARRFTKFESIELIDEKTPDNASKAENKAILDKEGHVFWLRLVTVITSLLLAIEGKQFPSEKFAKELEKATP